MLERGGFGRNYEGTGAEIAIKVRNYANAERSLYSLQGMAYGQKTMTNDRIDRRALTTITTNPFLNIKLREFFSAIMSFV